MSLLLLAAIGLVVTRTYQLWQGPWNLPMPTKAISSSVSQPLQEHPQTFPLVNISTIIDMDLFHPERGEGKSREAAAVAAATRRIRSMVLVGTAILGEGRYAILRELSGPYGAKSQPGQSTSVRLKLGDNLEGFTLSEVADRRVAFTNGNSRVELALDFLRGLDRTPGAAGRPVGPQGGASGRRERLPPPPFSN